MEGDTEKTLELVAAENSLKEMQESFEALMAEKQKEIEHAFNKITELQSEQKSADHFFSEFELEKPQNINDYSKKSAQSFCLLFGIIVDEVMLYNMIENNIYHVRVNFEIYWIM